MVGLSRLLRPALCIFICNCSSILLSSSSALSCLASPTLWTSRVCGIHGWGRALWDALALDKAPLNLSHHGIGLDSRGLDGFANGGN